MIKLSIIVFVLLFFSACSEDKPKRDYDAKKLLDAKCAACHELSMPPVISDDELAPPMMAIAFHMKDFMDTANESERITMATEFIIDYVANPSLEKSYCDKESIKRYGLMPSQKKNVTDGEVKAIAEYMFKHYTQDNLSKKIKSQAEYDALSPGKKIALKYKCMGCHRTERKVVGPSLKDIGKKYINNKEKIKQSIINGSRENWESSNGAVMPSFKQISPQELEIVSEWILSTTKDTK